MYKTNQIKITDLKESVLSKPKSKSLDTSDSFISSVIFGVYVIFDII